MQQQSWLQGLVSQPITASQYMLVGHIQWQKLAGIGVHNFGSSWTHFSGQFLL